MRWSRIGAGVIDFFTASMFGTLVFGVVIVIARELGISLTLTGENFWIDLGMIVLGFIYIIMVHVVYQVIFYKWFGGSFGKVIMRIRVVDVKGKPLSSGALFEREVNKWSLIYITLMLYAVYAGIQIVRNGRIYHDVRFGSKITRK